MKPCDENELNNLRQDFAKFLSLGNTDLKSAYLAISGRGFTNKVRTKDGAIMLERETDRKYVICSYSYKPEQVVHIQPERIIRFHIDKEIFN